MRHYCNKQKPTSANSITITPEPFTPEQPEETLNPASQNKNVPYSENSDDDLILPPVSQGLNTYTNDAQGGAVSQMGGYIKQLSEDYNNSTSVCPNGFCKMITEDTYYNGESGSVSVISLPKDSSSVLSMPAFLNRYKGKYICLDLWSSDGKRLEKCGVLLEIGDDFLVVRKGCTGELTLVNLKTIRYISVYCR